MKAHRGDLGHPKPSLTGPSGDIGWKRESGDDSWEAVCGGCLNPPGRWGPQCRWGSMECAMRQEGKKPPSYPTPFHAAQHLLALFPLHWKYHQPPMLLHGQMGFWMSPSPPHTPTPTPGMPDLWKRLLSQWTRPLHSQN